MVLTVLIHNCQPFDPAGSGPRLGNINHPGVKISLFSGQPLINGICHNMSHSAPIVLCRRKRLPFHLIFGKNIPQTKLNPQILFVNFLYRTLNQRLSVNRFPVNKLRFFFHRFEILNVAALVNNPEQPRTLQIGNNHIADFITVLSYKETVMNHLRKSYRHRIAHRPRNVNLQFGPSRSRKRQNSQNCP